jgi:hypothetical protein
MELRILFISLLPTVALAGALAAGSVEEDARPAGPQAAARVGTTVVVPARPDDASLAVLGADRR